MINFIIMIPAFLACCGNFSLRSKKRRSHKLPEFLPLSRGVQVRRTLEYSMQMVLSYVAAAWPQQRSTPGVYPYVFPFPTSTSVEKDACLRELLGVEDVLSIV